MANKQKNAAVYSRTNGQKTAANNKNYRNGAAGSRACAKTANVQRAGYGGGAKNGKTYANGKTGKTNGTPPEKKGFKPEYIVYIVLALIVIAVIVLVCVTTSGTGSGGGGTNVLPDCCQ